jgi:hypothetical protein
METMTVGSPEETVQSYEFEVTDGLGPRSLMGWKVAELAWTYEEARLFGHDHWTDITLYRVTGHTDMRYAIQIVGRSSIYHRVDGPCRYGVSMTVGAVAVDEERYEAINPCQRPGCRPKDLEYLRDEDAVKVEVPIPRLYECQDADEVVNVLYSHGRREGRPPSSLSVKILNAASLVDPEIKQALMRMRRG